MPGLFLPMLGSAQIKRAGGKYPSGHIRKSVTKERRLTRKEKRHSFTSDHMQRCKEEELLSCVGNCEFVGMK